MKFEHLQQCTEPAKVSCDGTQLEVACGKKFCKAAFRIKNADLVTTDRSGRETGGLSIFYKRVILRASTAIPRLASRCWRSLMTGFDKRRSVQSRRDIGLRRALRIFAWLLVCRLLSASLIVAAQAQTTSDVAGSTHTLWSVSSIRMLDVMRSSDGTIFILTQNDKKEKSLLVGANEFGARPDGSDRQFQRDA